MARILVVEGDPALCGMLEDCLKNEKHEVTVVHSGFEGWNHAQTGQYDFVLIDWDLPDVKGVDVVSRFRSQGGLTPMIMLTAHSSIADKEAALDAGANDYLIKPFHMRELSAKIRAVLRTQAAAPPLDNPLGKGNEAILNRANLAGTALASRYEILDIIGSGGCAMVLKARQPGLERLVAIKTMFTETLQPGDLERFQAEARAIADVSHYNIVTVHDCGLTERGQPFMVMEYIQGQSLREKITREGPLPFAITINILIQVCRGLQEAHNKGIIHRDLKPENILLRERSERADWVKLVDFGIARLVTSNSPKLTQAGALVGTPEYIAPERFRSSAADRRSDLYSLGVVLFEMLTNRGPYEADTLETVVLKALVEPIDPPSKFRKEIQPGSSFDRLVAKATAKNPDERHQTATELRLELEQLHNEVLLHRRL